MNNPVLSAGQLDYGAGQDNANNSLGGFLPYIDPMTRFPNILDSQVIVKTDNSLFEMHGIAKKIPKDLHLVKGENQDYNEYLDYIVYRLNALRTSPDKYWKFARFVACRSNTFKALMLHEVFPHWHRDMNLKELYLLVRKYNLMWDTLPANLKYRRVYIPKKVDEQGNVLKWRPLGVPTTAWRLYLHSWQAFLMIFLQDQISDDQHGFYKGRGTKTAWEAVLTKVIDSPNIYEFDLKGFFPSVNVGYCVNILRNLGLPDDLANHLFDISLSYPNVKSLDESKLDETNALFKAELDDLGLLRTEPKVYDENKHDYFSEETGSYDGKVLAPMYEFMKMNTIPEAGIDGKDLLIELMSEDLGYSKEEILANFHACCYEYYQVQSALFESFKPMVKPDSSQEKVKGTPFEISPQGESGKEPGFKQVHETQIEGFPQGSPISPILCSLVLGGSIFNKGQCLMYADDGLFYGDFDESQLETDQTMSALGISFAKEKCRWVKKDGKWLEVLKFLGVTYDPFEGSLRASTRKGATLSFNKESLIVEHSHDLLESKSKQSQGGRAIFHETIESLTEIRQSNRVTFPIRRKLNKYLNTYKPLLQKSPLTSARVYDEFGIGLLQIYEELMSVLSEFSAPTIHYFKKLYSQTLSRFYLQLGYEPLSLEQIIQDFNWAKVIDLELFGFVMARLYCNSWNFKPNQDFAFFYKPYS